MFMLSFIRWIFRWQQELGEMLSKLGIQDVETIQIAVSRLSANHSFKQQPAPWIITGRGE